jgi:hypothetical protein
MNTFQNGTFNVIHSSGNTDFNTYVYSAVYCNQTAQITLNGETVECVAGETLPIIVDGATTTHTTDFLLLGNPKPAGLNKTGKISGTTYQWTDIKTGLPIQQS